MYSMQKQWATQLYWVYQNKCIMGAYGKTIRKCTLRILKFLKKKARGFSSLAQGKEIDSGIVA